VPLPPSIEDKYEVLAKLEEGGMGAVYKVRHRLLDEVRVVKVVLPDAGPSAEMRDRFLREARAASRLRHPNIAQILDFLVGEEGQQLLVLEYIDGPTLKEVVALSGPPPLGLTLEIARQALEALGSLHRAGFVHRDVAPDNLMLARDAAGAPLVKLIDLGIAKALTTDTGGRDGALTQAGTFLGKPRYASPEQLAGDPVDARSDLYSFGLVLYELLTGHSPFAGSSFLELLSARLREPLSFAESDPEGRVPPALREIVLRLLARRPEDRFSDAGELAAALGELAESWPVEALEGIRERTARTAGVGTGSVEVEEIGIRPVSEPTRRTVEPAPPPPPAPRPAARLSPARALVALGGIALITLIGLGLWMARSRSTGKPAPDNVPAAQQPVATPAPAETSPPLPGGFTPAQPLDRPQPVYPEKARGRGLIARVTVDLSVDESGRVIRAVAPFVDSQQEIPWDLYRPLQQAALKAARALRFQPAMRDGVPVRDKVRLVVDVTPDGG
jgi:serine/threonine-protein kinase